MFFDRLKWACICALLLPFMPFWLVYVLIAETVNSDTHKSSFADGMMAPMAFVAACTLVILSVVLALFVGWWGVPIALGVLAVIGFVMGAVQA